MAATTSSYLKCTVAKLGQIYTGHVIKRAHLSNSECMNPYDVAAMMVGKKRVWFTYTSSVQSNGSGTARNLVEDAGNYKSQIRS